jgi:hypothetical protein
MSDGASATDRDQMRRWLANWRVVNETRDELVRSAPPSDPVACLARGLSLIDFARRLHESRGDDDALSDSEDESVRETWVRLHASRTR